MKTNFMMKGLFLLALGGMVFVSSCNDDDDPVVDPLIGVYQFTNATLAEPLVIVLTGDTEASELPEGTDVTLVIGSILAGASPCENPLNAAIELADGGAFYYTCSGETVDRVESGTWSSDATAQTITLNIISQTLGPLPPIVVSDYVITSVSLTGTVAGFPVPRDINYPLGGPEPPPANIQNAVLNVSFAKIQ